MARTSDPTPFMRTALRLAQRGRGWVEPNPMVGCVLVRDRRVIGQGYHRRFGGPHAEVNALRDCARRGNSPRGATAYVTLEPCCHHGKTPPCTEALIAAKVARLVAAMRDPFPQVAGRGAASLRAAGIGVEFGLCDPEARRLNEAYLHRLATALPWVIVKWAQTLDGRIATASGDSRWVSNEASRRLVHQLRARVDAVVVGIGTVLADDPLLTARGVPVRRAALRVVIDPRLRLPERCALLRSAHGVLVATRQTDSLKAKRLQDRGVELFPLTGESRRADLAPLLGHLVERHRATNILVEGGAALTGSLLEQGLVNQVLAFVTPRILGDDKAIAAVSGLRCAAMRHARELSLRAVKRLGDDVMLDYRVVERRG